MALIIVAAVTSVAVFVIGALVSLSTSWVLVSRLERLAERAGLSEGLLGVIAALAADAPEVTSAITALAYHQQRVIIGAYLIFLGSLLATACAAGPGTGVIIVPAAIADEIAAEAVEMTAFEDFVTEQVQGGQSILGLYPPTDEANLTAFEVWRKAKGR